MASNHSFLPMLMTLVSLSAPMCAQNPNSAKPISVDLEALKLQGSNLRVEFDATMKSRIVGRFEGKDLEIGPFAASESIRGTKNPLEDFPVTTHKREHIQDALGTGERLVVSGTAASLIKTVAVTIYDAFPTLAVFDVSYTNTGKTNFAVKGWTNNAYSLEAKPGSEALLFWSYQSGSYESRPNWILPVPSGFHQDNFMGMNASDYGGGTPVVDVWTREVGIGVGHLETSPKLISLPVTSPDASHVQVAVNSDTPAMLKPGATFHTLRTFASVHQGDYFRTLTAYRSVMEKQGFKMATAPDSAFDPIWCAWGYGRAVQPKQVYETLPTVKKLGFTWVTFDDGWQDNYADWNLDPKKFPNGDADMKAIVDRIHKDGFKAQLWWAPMMTAPHSRLLQEHPDYSLLNKDGSKQKVSYWDSFYLCPTHPKVIAMTQAMVKKIMVDWGFDGLKLDGQYMNAAPPCYNKAHHHVRPEEAVEGVPTYFKAIFDEARNLKPDALVEFCPCGTAYSFFTMPNYNMAVGSDPCSGFQVRSKGKTLKALMGDGVAYFGDHVELTNAVKGEVDDFASTLGIGGVVGTQFILPGLAGPASPENERSILTPEREQQFVKWLAIYKDKMLSKGHYIGDLYDIGFDYPEAHVVRKGQSLYYAFFAKTWKGEVELRGLEDRDYRILDYENGKELGTVHGPKARISTAFEKHLLVEAVPQ